jgi:hypothetical protein
MNPITILMLKVDCQQDIVTREQFHKIVNILKLLPEYQTIIKKSYK